MITGIIMASGFSNRMGENKLLIELDGVRLIDRVISEAKKSDLDKLILIYREDEIKKIGDFFKIETIYNKNANLGQSESMKLGIRNTDSGSSYMFLVGDQPFLTKDIINNLIDSHKLNKNKIVVPHYNGKRGMPTIFPSIFREELLKIDGDIGGRDIIIENRDKIVKLVFDKKYGLDIDTKEDLLRVENFD